MIILAYDTDSRHVVDKLRHAVSHYHMLKLS